MASGGPAGGRGWTHNYATRLLVSDALAIVIAVVTAQLLRFGGRAAGAEIGRDSDIELSYTAISVILVLAWLLVLTVHRTRDPRVVGVGSGEYRLVVTATLWLFGIGAILFFVFQIPFARAYLLIALPYGIVLLLLGRWLCRQWLVRQRLGGGASYRVLLVGSANGVTATATELASRPASGYLVVGAVVPGADGDTTRLLGGQVPVTGDVDAVPERMRALGADTLAITGSAGLSPDRIRTLSWELEPRHQHLVMVPSLTDVAGPRIHTRPVAGLQLMHVETPTFAGPQLLAKRLFDLIVAAVLVVVLSPFLLVMALIVALTSRGPVIFRQERVGYGGRTFRMLKFRSMVADAEDQLGGLLDRERDAGNDVLFKLKEDPRLTPVGRFMRRYSIDELPQLVNVLAGSMSLVGPRPPLPREVERYEERVLRKFLVKPGITGLWQVNGRSALTWEESVRLDLYYVENWSLMGDVVVLWRTLRAVIAREGAY